MHGDRVPPSLFLCLIGAFASIVYVALGAQAAAGQTYSRLHDFEGAAGRFPNGLVQARDGNFYGTTKQGGPDNQGTAFRMTPTGAVTVLHEFPTTQSDGSQSFGRLVEGSDGYLYGTTVHGGASGCGTVFKMATSGVMSVLHSFHHRGGGAGLRAHPGS
jgi:uncharacterized repeat protein (TIGR03803 family)